jgi:hypothetical protein
MKFISASYTRASGIGLLVVAPLLASAQTGGTVQNLFAFVLSIINDYLVPIVFAIAFIVFLFGIYRYFIQGGGSDESVKEGRKFLMWSIIGFVVMFSIWGIINLFLNTLGFGTASQPGIPTFSNTTSGTTGLPSSSIFPTTNTTGNQIAPTTDNNGNTFIPTTGTDNTNPSAGMETCSNGVSVPISVGCGSVSSDIMCDGDPAPAGSTCCAGGGYAQAGSSCPTGAVSPDQTTSNTGPTCDDGVTMPAGSQCSQCADGNQVSDSSECAENNGGSGF